VNERERYFFDLYGYVLVEDVLTAAELAAANRAIDALRLPPPRPDDGSPRFHGFLEWEEPLFRRLIDHPRIVPYLKEICGEGFRLDHEYGIYMRRSEAGLGLHGGGTPFDPSQYYLVRGGRMYNGLVVVSWALTDIPPGAGGFCCIPGSHKQEWRPPQGSGSFGPESLLRQVPQPAGSVLIFTEALRHGTLPWQADHERRSLLYKYCPGHMAWGRRQPSPQLLARLTENQRRVLEPPYVWQRKPIEVPGEG
jgi:ectoine hydroxylase-related dioxygenase (phytanoyl-CoA dioxygenase family)